MNIKLKNGMEVEISPSELAELNKNNISLDVLFGKSTTISTQTPVVAEISEKPEEKVISHDKFDVGVVRTHYNITAGMVPCTIYNKEYNSFKNHKKYSWEFVKEIKPPKSNVIYHGFNLKKVEKHYGHKIEMKSKEYNKEWYHYRSKGYYSWEDESAKNTNSSNLDNKILYHGFDKKMVDKHFGKKLVSTSSEYKKEHNFYYRHGRYSWEPAPSTQSTPIDLKPATNMPFKQNSTVTFIGFDKKVFLKHKGLPVNTVIDNDAELKKEYCTEQGFYNKHGYYSWFKGIDLDYYTWRRMNKEFHKKFQALQETNPKVFKYYNNAMMMCNIVNGKINGNTVQRKVLNAKYMNAWFKANESLLTNPDGKLQELFVYDAVDKIFKPAK